MIKQPRTIFESLSALLSSVLWCLKISWDASRPYTLFRAAGEVARPLLTIFASFLGKYLIDLLAAPDRHASAEGFLLALFAGLLAVAVLRSGIQTAGQYSQAMHGDIIGNRIALTIMNRSLDIDLEYYDNPAYHDKLTMAGRDMTAIAHIVWNVISCVGAGVSFIGVSAVLCQFNAMYGVMMMAAAIPSSIMAAKYTKSLYQLSVEQINSHRQMGYVQAIAAERSHAQDIRLFGSGEWLKERYSRIWRELFAKTRRMAKRRARFTGVLDCLPELVIVLIGIDIAREVLRGAATVGDYSLYTGMVAGLWGAIHLFSASVMQVYDNRLKIENMKSLDEFQNRVTDEGNMPLSSVDSIEFSGVSFTYPGTVNKALDNLCFCLHREQNVALVGLNGSGKSTLIKLLLRMYDPQDGIIRINGHDIREYRLSELRANFSVYFQEMQNFALSLHDNFHVTDQGRDDAAAAKEALQYAHGHDILEKAAKGLDTGLTRYFDPDGLELSGGQHQKLALARALYRRHTVLVLDEPSSNLDPLAEHMIFESLRELTAGKMTIFTSHRLSNVFLADRIIVLEEGKIIEDGAPAELLANNKRYAELFKYQKERYLVP